MQTTIELADNSDCTHRHGALVYKSGKILSRGWNILKNTPDFTKDFKGGISVHAEISAMSRVSAENLRGSTIYVARRRKCNTHGLSLPCPRCYEALVDAGVKRVVYTD